MAKYTAFCQQTNGRGTIWIDSVEADTDEEAIEAAQEACASDWDYSPADVHVLGLIKGDVSVVYWDDLGD